MPCSYWTTTEGEPELCTLTRAAILYLYTGAMMRDITVEQYYMVYPGWNGSALTQQKGMYPVSFML